MDGGKLKKARARIVIMDIGDDRMSVEIEGTGQELVSIIAGALAHDKDMIVIFEMGVTIAKNEIEEEGL